MVDARVALSGGAYLVTALLWALVGWRMWRRPGTGPSHRVSRRFGAWWLGLAGHAMAGAVLAAAVAFDLVGPLVLHAVLLAAAAFIGLFSWGIVSYFVFLYTGRQRVLRIVTAVYAVETAVLAGFVLLMRPSGAHVSGWNVVIEWAHPWGATFDALVGFAFLLPALFGSIAYVTLYRRAEGRTRRFRVAVVGGSITAWFVGSIVLGAVPLPVDASSALGRSLGIVAALLVLAAYQPPAWLQRRARIERLGHEVPLPPLTPAQLASRRAAAVARVRDLV